jgi:competence protein ComEA
MHLTRQELHAALFVALSLLTGGLVTLYSRYDPAATPGLIPPGAADDGPGAAGPALRAAAPDTAAAAPAVVPSKVNLNTASAAALQSLPGIGPALAARIIAHRQKIGAFRSPRQLLDVKGIGPAKLARLTPHITL